MKALTWIAAAAALAGSTVFVVTNSAAASGADEPPPMEEDFDYPGKAEILAKEGLALDKGDGHILFVKSVVPPAQQCAPNEIQVEKHRPTGDPYTVGYCFKLTGSSGWLTLQVPGNVGIRGGTKPLVATAKLPEDNAKPEPFPIPAGKYVPIDPGDDENPPKKVLIELRFG